MIFLKQKPTWIGINDWTVYTGDSLHDLWLTNSRQEVIMTYSLLGYDVM
jgi:hypothetical protein